MAEVRIRGTRPMLINVFGRESIPLEKKEKTGVAGNDPEEWKRTYRATSTGQLCLDSSYIFGCLVNGSKHTKSGRGSIQSKVAATLEVTDPYIMLNRWIKPEEITEDPTQPVYLDVRSVINPNSKGRWVRYRVACSPGWELDFHLQWDETVVNRQQMEAVIIDAGKLVGLADGRKIGFGRFEKISFEVEKIAEKKTS